MLRLKTKFSSSFSVTCMSSLFTFFNMQVEEIDIPIFSLQMWDLRFATSPMKVLEGHQRYLCYFITTCSSMIALLLTHYFHLPFLQSQNGSLKVGACRLVGILIRGVSRLVAQKVQFSCILFWQDLDLKFILVYRGILSIAWCPQDPDLLMSCAKVIVHHRNNIIYYM